MRSSQIVAFAFLLSFFSVFAEAETLDFEHVFLLDLAGSAGTIKQERLKAYIDSVYATELRQVKFSGDQEKVDAFYDSKQKEIVKRIKDVEKIEFTMNHRTHFRYYDEEKKVAVAGMPLPYWVMPLNAPANTNVDPKHFLAVFSNPWESELHIPFASKEEYENFIKLRTLKFGKKQAKAISIEFSLEPVKKLKEGQWMFTITQTLAYQENYTEKELIYKKTIKHESSYLDNHPLKYGIADEFSPIHNLFVWGFALGEVMPYIDFFADVCHWKGKVNQHNIMECMIDSKGKNTRVGLVYLDGRLAEINEYWHLENNDTKSLKVQLTRKYKGNYKKGNTWKNGNISIYYHDPVSGTGEKWHKFITARHPYLEKQNTK